MRGIDHPEENRENGPLDVVTVLDNADDGSPIHAQTLHLIGLHDRMRSVKPPVANEREEEERGLTKLEGSVILERVADTGDERGLRRVEALECLDGNGSRGISQRSQGVLNWLVLIFTTGSQIKVMVQECENVMRIPDPWQKLVPFVGPMHGATRCFPLLILGVGGGNWGPHDNMEQIITLLGYRLL